MVIIRFRSSEDHEDLLKKVKKMKKFTQELEDCLEEATEDESFYRGSYRKDEDGDYEMKDSRYGYRRGGRR